MEEELNLIPEKALSDLEKKIQGLQDDPQPKEIEDKVVDLKYLPDSKADDENEDEMEFSDSRQEQVEALTGKLANPVNVKKSFEMKYENDDDDEIYIVHDEYEDD